MANREKDRESKTDPDAGEKMRKAVETAHTMKSEAGLLGGRGHVIYFTLVVGGGFLLNLAVLALVAR